MWTAAGDGSMPLSAVTCVLAVAVLAFMPGVAAAAPDPPDPGETSSGIVMSNGTEYRYLRYTPTSYAPDRPAPLLVMVHGCQTTAEQEMRLTLYNQLAEREGFVVLYPDVDELGRTQPGPANQCWKFPWPPSWTRDNSDAAAIADMTRATMASRSIDAERVYLVGVSAGGLMAAIDAAAYPDLFAAVGNVASAGYVDWPCFTTGVGIPVSASARLAFEQMGPRARVVPIIAIGSDADQAFPAACTEKALEQGLRTSNLVLSGNQEGPIALTPASVSEEQKPGGYAYTVGTFRDPDGCLIGERWIIHGMPHAWPGGSTDPKWSGYTDMRAPSGAEATWAFLERYRKSDTAMPCAEAPPPSSTFCRARWLTVRVPAGAKRVRATVNGRRAKVRLTRRRARIQLAAFRRTRTSVVVRGRTGAGGRFLRRHTYSGCGPERVR